MNERYRQHEQARRDLWAAAYVKAIGLPRSNANIADAALSDYDAKFPKPIEGEQYLQQEAQGK